MILSIFGFREYSFLLNELCFNLTSLYPLSAPTVGAGLPKRDSFQEELGPECQSDKTLICSRALIPRGDPAGV